MDEQRIQDYLYLIQELLRCSPGREEAVLSDNPDLLDAGLVEMMKQMAAAEKNLATANRLKAFAELVEKKLNLPSRGDREESVNKDKLNVQFLMEILRAMAYSNGNYEAVYPLLKANLDKLDDDFAHTLGGITALPEFSRGEPKAGEYIAMAVLEFCNLIQQFPQGNKATNMEIAIAGYEEVVKVLNRESNPESWAAIQNNLGTSYIYRIKGNKADNLENAIRCFTLALSVRTREKFPSDWAATQNNLGDAYINRVSGNKAENLENAIGCLNQALKVYTKEKFPIKWASVQNNLGNAYNQRLRGNRADNLENAIKAYQLALEVRTKEQFIFDWAVTQNNLANAYLYRIKGDREENLENAIDVSIQALEVCTKEKFPYMWAIIQNNLGTFYLDRIKKDKKENIEKAINCLTLALKVYSKKYSADWAKIQVNLGDAYLYLYSRIKEDKEENLEDAISYFILALEVYTKERFPYMWATIQRNLGSAYAYRSSADREDNLAQAIRYFTLALEVHTKKDFPIQWARTQYNLGNAYVYLDRMRGSRVENLKNAILHFNLSLEINTPQAHPIECLSISRRLGDIHFTQSNWRKAIDAYEKAITAVELSRSWAMNDDRRQKIMAEAIDVYQKLVQAYINIGQWNKAIETVERSKARNLVELLTNRDLYPKGDVPQEIIAQLDKLRRNIPSLERQLQVATDQLSGNMDRTEQQQRLALEESQKRLQQELQQSRQQLDEVLNQIKPFDSSFSLTQKVETIRFGEIQSLVDEQTAMIQWYITDDKILTSVITHHNSQPIIIQSSAEQLKAFAIWGNKYLSGYYEQNQQWKNDLSSYLVELAEILKIDDTLAEIYKIFARKEIKCDRLILISYRFLHLLPLHALPLANGNLLCDRFPKGVSYAPSCQLLQLSQKRQCLDFNRLFAIQNPTEDLVFTNLEVETIRSLFSSATVLATKAAREADIKVHQELPLAHCNHFSCHGEFNLEFPLKSALRLAETKESNSENTEDGLLTLAEIFALNLTQSRLVTLSACETGMADFNSLSDEYVSLPSGFLFAGSPSVVSSLWEVSDISTSFLMIKFYENLQQFPQREIGKVALALNQAQEWLRNLSSDDCEIFLNYLKPQCDRIIANLPKREGKRVKAAIEGARKQILERSPHPFANPYYWAAFTATGF